MNRLYILFFFLEHVNGAFPDTFSSLSNYMSEVGNDQFDFTLSYDTEEVMITAKLTINVVQDPASFDDMIIGPMTDSSEFVVYSDRTDTNNINCYIRGLRMSHGNIVHCSLSLVEIHIYGDYLKSNKYFANWRGAVRKRGTQNYIYQEDQTLMLYQITGLFTYTGDAFANKPTTWISIKDNVNVNNFDTETLRIECHVNSTGTHRLYKPQVELGQLDPTIKISGIPGIDKYEANIIQYLDADPLICNFEEPIIDCSPLASGPRLCPFRNPDAVRYYHTDQMFVEWYFWDYIVEENIENNINSYAVPNRPILYDFTNMNHMKIQIPDPTIGIWLDIGGKGSGKGFDMPSDLLVSFFQTIKSFINTYQTIRIIEFDASTRAEAETIGCSKPRSKMVFYATKECRDYVYYHLGRRRTFSQTSEWYTGSAAADIGDWRITYTAKIANNLITFDFDSEENWQTVMTKKCISTYIWCFEDYIDNADDKDVVEILPIFTYNKKLLEEEYVYIYENWNEEPNAITNNVVYTESKDFWLQNMYQGIYNIYKNPGSIYKKFVDNSDYNGGSDNFFKIKKEEGRCVCGQRANPCTNPNDETVISTIYIHKSDVILPFGNALENKNLATVTCDIGMEDDFDNIPYIWDPRIIRSDACEEVYTLPYMTILSDTEIKNECFETNTNCMAEDDISLFIKNKENEVSCISNFEEETSNFIDYMNSRSYVTCRKELCSSDYELLTWDDRSDILYLWNKSIEDKSIYEDVKIWFWAKDNENNHCLFIQTAKRPNKVFFNRFYIDKENISVFSFDYFVVDLFQEYPNHVTETGIYVCGESFGTLFTTTNDLIKTQVEVLLEGEEETNFETVTWTENLIHDMQNNISRYSIRSYENSRTPYMLDSFSSLPCHPPTFFRTNAIYIPQEDKIACHFNIPFDLICNEGNDWKIMISTTISGYTTNEMFYKDGDSTQWISENNNNIRLATPLSQLTVSDMYIPTQYVIYGKSKCVLFYIDNDGLQQTKDIDVGIPLLNTLRYDTIVPTTTRLYTTEGITTQKDIETTTGYITTQQISTETTAEEATTKHIVTTEEPTMEVTTVVVTTTPASTTKEGTTTSVSTTNSVVTTTPIITTKETIESTTIVFTTENKTTDKLEETTTFRLTTEDNTIKTTLSDEIMSSEMVTDAQTTTNIYTTDMDTIYMAVPLEQIYRIVSDINTMYEEQSTNIQEKENETHIFSIIIFFVSGIVGISFFLMTVMICISFFL